MDSQGLCEDHFVALSKFCAGMSSISQLVLVLMVVCHRLEGCTKCKSESCVLHRSYWHRDCVYVIRVHEACIGIGIGIG